MLYNRQISRRKNWKKGVSQRHRLKETDSLKHDRCQRFFFLSKCPVFKLNILLIPWLIQLTIGTCILSLNLIVSLFNWIECWGRVSEARETEMSKISFLTYYELSTSKDKWQIFLVYHDFRNYFFGLDLNYFNWSGAAKIFHLYSIFFISGMFFTTN